MAPSSRYFSAPSKYPSRPLTPPCEADELDTAGESSFPSPASTSTGRLPKRCIPPRSFSGPPRSNSWPTQAAHYAQLPRYSPSGGHAHARYADPMSPPLTPPNERDKAWARAGRLEEDGCASGSSSASSSAASSVHSSPVQEKAVLIPSIVLTPPHSPYPQPLLDATTYSPMSRRRSRRGSVFSSFSALFTADPPASPSPSTADHLLKPVPSQPGTPDKELAALPLPLHHTQTFLLGPHTHPHRGTNAPRILRRSLLFFPLLMLALHVWLTACEGGRGLMSAGDALVFGVGKVRQVVEEERKVLWDHLVETASATREYVDVPLVDLTGAGAAAATATATDEAPADDDSAVGAWQDTAAQEGKWTRFHDLLVWNPRARHTAAAEAVEDDGVAA